MHVYNLFTLNHDLHVFTHLITHKYYIDTYSKFTSTKYAHMAPCPSDFRIAFIPSIFLLPHQGTVSRTRRASQFSPADSRNITGAAIKDAAGPWSSGKCCSTSQKNVDDPGDQAISSSLVTGFGFAPIQLLNTAYQAYHLAVQIW